MSAKILDFKSHSKQEADALIGALEEGADTAILIWHKDDKWFWDFYGKLSVAEMLGAMEVCKEDVLRTYREHPDA